MDVLRASAELHDGQRNREALPDASARQESSRSGFFEKPMTWHAQRALIATRYRSPPRPKRPHK